MSNLESFVNILYIDTHGSHLTRRPVLQESRISLCWPWGPAEGAQQWKGLRVSVGGPHGHAVVVQQVATARLARHQALALHHHRQADWALCVLLTATGKRSRRPSGRSGTIRHHHADRALSDTVRQIGHCTFSSLQQGRDADTVFQIGHCESSSLQEERDADTVMQIGHFASSSLQQERDANTGKQIGHCSSSSLQQIQIAITSAVYVTKRLSQINFIIYSISFQREINAH